MSKLYVFDLVLFSGKIELDNNENIISCSKQFQQFVGKHISELQNASRRQKHSLQMYEVEPTVKGESNAV